MRPELQRLVDELTEVRAAIAAVDDTRRKATNGWTVGGVLDHLAKVHEATLPRYRAALDAAPDLVGEETVRYSFLDRQIVRAMGGKSFKIPVPPMFAPDEASPDAKARCLASIDGLLEVLRQADAKRLADVRVPMPLNGRIKLKLLPYLDSNVQHARYHRGQI